MSNRYNITKNLNAYGGRNRYSIAIGNTRNSPGSSNRIFNYCNRISSNPFYCMFGINRYPPTPIPPLPPPAQQNHLYYTFNCSYTPLTQNIIQSYIPLITIPGTFEIEPIITINGTNVSVYIKITKIDINNPNDFGLTFNQYLDPMSYFDWFPDFYTNYTSNLTFVSSYNCPLSRGNGIDGPYQFSFLTDLTFNNNFSPLILPNTRLGACFQGCSNFNSDITKWDTTNVIDMDGMFSNASSFNQPIGNWNVSNVTTMNGMFFGASSFNQPIGNWNVSNVTSMSGMFRGVSSFNQPIGNWDVSNVTTMNYMFYYNTSFNQDISGWNVSNVTDMTGMFQYSIAFNKPLTWNTINVTNMDFMFRQSNFNSEINFNLNNIISLEAMFYNNTVFNSNITLMNIGSANPPQVNMLGIFWGATNFNKNINWDMSNVTNMNYMFFGATNFNNGVPIGNSSPLNWSISNAIYTDASSGGILNFNLYSGIKNSDTTASYNSNSVSLGTDNP